MRLAAFAQLNWALGLELSDQLQPAVLIQNRLARLFTVQLLKTERLVPTPADKG